MLKLPLDSLAQQAEFATLAKAAIDSLSANTNIFIVLVVVFLAMLPELSRELRAWLRELRRK